MAGGPTGIEPSCIPPRPPAPPGIGVSLEAVLAPPCLPVSPGIRLIIVYSCRLTGKAKALGAGAQCPCTCPIPGSFERFIGILIEHDAGNLPLWLAPRQVVVATITSDADGYAKEVRDTLEAAGLRAELDLRNEKIGYQVREHSLAKVPVLLVAGRREAEYRQVAVRRLGDTARPVLALDDCVTALSAEATAPDTRGQTNWPSS